MGWETALMAAPTLYQILNPADNPTGIAQTQAPTQGSQQVPRPVSLPTGAGQPDPMAMLLQIMMQLSQTQQPGASGPMPEDPMKLMQALQGMPGAFGNTGF